MLGDDPQDFPTSANRSHKIAGDLGLTGDSSPVVHGNLLHPQTVAVRLDLHLDRPPEIRVLHLQPLQRFAPDHPEGAKVGIASPEK